MLKVVTVVIGNELAMQENSIVIDNQKAAADKLRMEGATVIYVATDGKFCRPDSYLDPVKANPRRMRLKLASGRDPHCYALTGITSLPLKQSHGNWE